MADRVRGTVQSLFLSDVEMGKKDDDHRRPSTATAIHGLLPSVWAASRVQPRKFFKRALLMAFFLLLVYLFVHNIPTDVGIRDHRRPVYLHPGDKKGGDSEEAVAAAEDAKEAPEGPSRVGPPPFSQRFNNDKGEPGGAAAAAAAAAAAGLPDTQAVLEARKVLQEGGLPSYNGKVRFMKLSPSLRGIANTRGGFLINKNVMFAASDVKSMATLLPLACQMGQARRSYVHFVVMGRSDIKLDELQAVNGIDESCGIIFHDARPDYGDISSEKRMQKSITFAMSHIELFMHPQAIIVDGTEVEEDLIILGMREYAKPRQVGLIELPWNAAKRVGWLTQLDSASLSQWNRISFDILIHASPDSSGSLIRLLKSLNKADFGGGLAPHVTIELPHKVDPPTKSFLEGFEWPPEKADDPMHVRQLSLRHRIPQFGISEEDSSVRFLESFWPVNPENSHVLVLSPQTELSPNFFHYLKYSLLEYRYSAAAQMQEWDQRLLGISLELPPKGLDGTTAFVPPAPLLPPKGNAIAERAMAALRGSSADDEKDSSSFLWQAPNSNAVLFLGERWVELHSFVSQCLEREHAAQSSASSTGGPQQTSVLPQKLAGKKFPAWLEHALRLSQARGFWTLYPSTTLASSLATVHHELYRPPEEYDNDDDKTKTNGRIASVDANDDGNEEGTLGSKSLLEALPTDGGALPSFSEMPLLSWDGKTATLDALNAQVLAYAAEFRRTVGGCTAEEMALLKPDELFCNKE